MLRRYENAPRLPEGALIDVRQLARGQWVELEVGPGRGWFLVERAEAEPHAALIGLEIRRKWAAVVDARLANRGLHPRARVFAEDAGFAMSRLGPPGAVRRVFLNFPDPWWKRRHQKRLLLRPAFLDEAARLLEARGELFLQTDVEERALVYERLIASDARFEPAGDEAASARVAENPYRARSPRERRVLADGLAVHRLRWVRVISLGLALAGFLSTPRADAAVATAQVRATKGPYLTGLSDTGADVRVELDRAQPATLSVSREADSGQGALIVESPQSADSHLLRATGLDPATHYGYAVRAGSTIVGGGSFTTAPSESSETPVTFIVCGDERTDPASHSAVVKAMAQVPSSFLINTGDMVEDGASASDWQSFFDVESSVLRDRPVFAAVGNHELFDDSAGANFARYFGFPDERGQLRLYGTTRFGLVRLFFIDSMHDWGAGEERDWLERELARADTEKGLVWRIAIAHQGPYSAGPHGGNAQLIDAQIPELLVRHRVDMILSGHDHIYERGAAGALKYVVSGGGGAPLYRVREQTRTTRRAEATFHFVEVTAAADALRLVARRVDGTLLDQCSFRPGQPWDCDPSPASSAANGQPSSQQDDASVSRAWRVPASVAVGVALAGGVAAVATFWVRRRARS